MPNPYLEQLQRQGIQPSGQPMVGSSGSQNPYLQQLQSMGIQPSGKPILEQEKGGFFNPREGTILNQQYTKRGKEVYGGQKGPLKELVGGVSEIGQSVGNRVENIKDIRDAYQSGEQKFGRSFLQGVGQALGGVGDIIGQGTMALAEAVTPEFAERIVSRGINKTVNNIANGKLAQNAIHWYSQLPEAARRDIDALTSAAGGILEIAGIGAVPGAVSSAKNVASRGVSSILEEGVTGALKKGATKISGAVDDVVRPVGESIARKVGAPLNEPLERTIKNNLRNAGIENLDAAEALDVISSTQKSLIRSGLGGDEIQKTLGVALKTADAEKGLSKLSTQIEDSIYSKRAMFNKIEKTFGTTFDAKEVSDLLANAIADAGNFLGKSSDDFMHIGKLSGIKTRKVLNDYLAQIGKQYNDIIGADTTPLNFKELIDSIDTYLAPGSDIMSKAKISPEVRDSLREAVKKKMITALNETPGSLTNKKAKDIYKLMQDIQPIYGSTAGNDQFDNAVKKTIKSTLRQYIRDAHPNKALTELADQYNEYYGRIKDASKIMGGIGTGLDTTRLSGMRGIFNMSLGFGASGAVGGPFSAVAFPLASLAGDRVMQSLIGFRNVRKTGLNKLFKNSAKEAIITTGLREQKDVIDGIEDIILSSKKLRNEASADKYYEDVFKQITNPEFPIPQEQINTVRKDIQDSISTLTEVRKELNAEKQAVLKAKTPTGTDGKRSIVEVEMELQELNNELSSYKNMLNKLPTAVPGASPSLQQSGMDEIQRSGLFR